MAELSSFFDANMVNGVPDRQYDATAWANYFSGFIGNGVSSTPSTNLQVTAGTGLQVIVNSGIGYINGYYYNNTEPLTVNINTANATYPRITSIVIELNLNNREIICKTVDGNAQTSPTAPQITQTQSTYQLQLATVYVQAGGINCGVITDTRDNAEVCGYITMLAPTPPPPIITDASITSGVIVQENGGSINYNNENGINIINEGVDGNTFVVTNSQTNNNIISVTPVSSGTDTVDIGANVNLDTVLTCQGGNSGINFSTTDGKYNIGFSAEGNNDTFILYDNTNNEGIISYSPVNKELNLNGTINGGTISNVTLDNVNITGAVNNNTTISGGALLYSLIKECTLTNPTFSGNTNVTGIMNITEGSSAIFYLDNEGNACIEEAVDEKTWFIRNKYTGNIMIQSTPVTAGADTLDVYANLNINDNINFLNENNKNIISINVGNDSTWQVSNALTNNNILQCEPVSSGVDTLDVYANINLENSMNVEETGGYINFLNSNNDNIAQFTVNKDTFMLSNSQTGNAMLGVTPVTSGTDTLNLYANLDCSGGTIVNPGFTGTVMASGEQLIDYYTETHSQHVAPGVQGACEISCWLLNAPLLTGQTMNGSIGIITMSITLDNTYCWPPDNTQKIDMPSLPVSSARTMTPSEYFQIGTSKGIVYLAGAGQTLQAGQTYTTKALIWQ